VQLSSLLAGEVTISDLSGEYLAGSYSNVERRFGCPVTQIDRKARRLIDQCKRSQPYSTLILATGSTPRIPDYVDQTLPGVFTFRNLTDAKALAERRGLSSCTVVLGGGLLGLEAAKAMHSSTTKVVVIDRGERLLEHRTV
jgi:nitrite reductase (NADH) large subunit